ncbi:MAG: response regulator, partial [Archangium sp.]|nr:response regulator [Archangium sp.]
MQPQKVKFLLVDDLEENLMVLSELLKRDEVELLTATSGRQALELLLVHEVALAFFDVQMPEMNGFELAELVRGSERTKHVPIIFVTGGVDDQHRLFKGYEAGAVDFLLKPIEPHVLKSKAEVFFQLSLQKQQLTQELKERTETLRLNEMFTAVLGHDLRNPLNAVLLGTEQLLRTSSDPAVQRVASRMQGSGKRMMRMIQ